jgi:hypothetical protein
MTALWDSLQRSVAKAANVDIKQIRGNISDAEKQINANLFVYFYTGSGMSAFLPYNSEIGRRLKLVELNVWDNASTATAEGEVVFEFEVTRGESKVSDCLLS